jgi:hypothetical protein
MFIRPRAHPLLRLLCGRSVREPIARSCSATTVTRSRTPDVETLACAVAGGYAGRWARSVARLHPRGDAAGAPAPWTVDGFAGADLQRAALRGAAAHPPAAAFLRAADEAFGPAARLVLVEEDPGLLSRVEDELRAAGAGDRLRRAADPSDAQPGDVVLVEAPFATVAARLAAAIADAPALVRLAPLTARALPWASLELLADLDAADLLLRVPGEDFARAGRFTGPLADFPPHLRRVVEGCSALLADERHAWLLAWRDALRAEGEDAALAAMVERLRARLGNGGGERVARAARLESAGAAVHLLLTTPHAEHALELNGAVMDGGGAPPVSAKPKSAARARSAASAPLPDAPESAASNAPAAKPAKSKPADAPVAKSASSAPVDAPAAKSPSSAPVEAPAATPAESAAEASVEATAEQSPAPRTSPAARPASTSRAHEPAPEEEPVLLDLFAMPAPPAPEPPRRPDLHAVADELHARHVGRRVPFRELLGDLADAGLAPEQVRTALGLLKRERRAAYRSLDADGAEVEFQDPPAVAPAPPPAPKPRKRPAPLPGVLGLFDDPEPDDLPIDLAPSTASAPDDDAPDPASGESAEPEATATPAVPDPSPPAKKPRRRKTE